MRHDRRENIVKGKNAALTCVERMFSILFRMSPHSTMTTSGLAKEYGVCKETIERDIDRLRNAGIVVHFSMPGYQIQISKDSLNQVLRFARHAGVVT